MEDGTTAGYALSYVDDFIVTGAPTAAGEFLNKLASTWKCSTPTWVSEGEWKKFCGVEMKWQGKGLLVAIQDVSLEKYLCRSWMITHHGRRDD